MELDKDKAARILGRLLSIRNFRKNLPLQQEVHKQEISRLVANMQQAVREFTRSNNSVFSLTLDVSSTFALFLKDGSSEPALVACYIETTQSGIIRLHFIPRGLEQHQEDLVLDSPWQSAYQWRSGDTLVMSESLTEFILQRLFEVASEAVRNEIV